MIILNSYFISDFLWCQNDSDTSDFPSRGPWSKRLWIYFAHVNPWADHLLQINHCFKEIMRNNGQFDPTHCIAGFFMNEKTNNIWNVMWIFILVSFGDYHLKSKLWCGINGLCNFLETEVSLNRQVRQKIYFAVSYSELPIFTMVNGTGIIWPQLLSRPGYITRLIPYHEGVLSTSHFSHCISVPTGYKPGYVMGLG